MKATGPEAPQEQYKMTPQSRFSEWCAGASLPLKLQTQVTSDFPLSGIHTRPLRPDRAAALMPCTWLLLLSHSSSSSSTGHEGESPPAHWARPGCVQVQSVSHSLSLSLTLQFSRDAFSRINLGPRQQSATEASARAESWMSVYLAKNVKEPLLADSSWGTQLHEPF